MPISPNQGPTSGGSTVTITGTNLANATRVNFNSNLGTITINTPTQVTVISPPGNSVAEVTVTTAGGTSNPLNFYYIEFPILVSLSTVSGQTAGGNTITLNGYNLLTASSVAFGANVATPTIISDSQISVVVPSGSGTVAVTVTTVGGTTASLNYSYFDTPTITTIDPISGPVSGGTAVTITGTNLSSTIQVTVGGTAASFGVINSTTVSIITPTGTVGAADVVVTTTAGSATAVGGFTYISEPAI